ncbi:enoyl-CoA hydratase/isomerase family protein [Actinomadura sp. CNU-125]|uniref:enoyl-CoA hydratase/isomerase family protein n=1 Tax=Actinomadura sp. CNU-125 TaxID=1904961 RepID=UPI0021CC71A8|nr:enoyl-CoA hydratase/isomerase family protein [Actinomadura sp. CNU-125]
MSVDVTRAGGITEITLNRPAKRNAMTDDMWGALEEILADLPDTRVLIITGAGGHSAAAPTSPDCWTIPIRSPNA